MVRMMRALDDLIRDVYLSDPDAVLEARDMDLLCPECARGMRAEGVTAIMASEVGVTSRFSVDHDAVGVARELVRVRRLVALKWEKLPPGWTDESVRRLWDSLTGGDKKKVTACVKKMEGR